MTIRSRRRFLGRAGALVAGAGLGAKTLAQPRSRPDRISMQEAIRRLAGNSAVHAGRVTLELPPLVENGNAVPLTVHVDSPMTAADHVRAIHVFNEKNPLPEIASFRLGPRAGRASVSTRVRLADTQTVTAVAEMSDGSFWSAQAHAVVTLAACLEEL